ncbi:MAG TPA: hypothetical protein VM888_07805 [Chitinophagaceae bacterium]|nr:hypothetical protein [Chitinophagaceae bacterium]
MMFLVYFLLAYLFYRLVFHFILPIYRTTQQVKKGFRDMQEKMNQPSGNTNGSSGGPKHKPTSNNKVGDYIDFEEVKD